MCPEHSGDQRSISLRLGDELYLKAAHCFGKVAYEVVNTTDYELRLGMRIEFLFMFQVDIGAAALFPEV